VGSLESLAAAGLLAVDGARGAAVGHDRALLAGACRRGELVRVRRGWYIGSSTWESLSPDQRYAAEVTVAARGLTVGVPSHWSAAALLSLPMVGRRGSAVHLTHEAAAGGRSGHGVVRHGSGVPPEVHEVDGIRVTSVSRTVVDLARIGGLVAGVCAADHALREQLTTLVDLARALDALGSARGIRSARTAVALATPRAESVGESLSRLRMHQLGVPAPTLQHVVTDARGFVGRVDFWWEGAGVVGEFDGRHKYGVGHGDDPRAAADRLWDEKRREDRIRATGAKVVRWTWSDAWAGAPMAAMLRAAGVR
jgi:hypothetical protein